MRGCASTVTVEWWGGQFHAGRTDPDADIVSLVRDTHTRAAGHAPETYGGPYGSDLRLLVGMGGIPTVQYGQATRAWRMHPTSMSTSRTW